MNKYTIYIKNKTKKKLENAKERSQGTRAHTKNN